MTKATHKRFTKGRWLYQASPLQEHCNLLRLDAIFHCRTISCPNIIMDIIELVSASCNKLEELVGK